MWSAPHDRDQCWSRTLRSSSTTMKKRATIAVLLAVTILVIVAVVLGVWFGIKRNGSIINDVSKSKEQSIVGTYKRGAVASDDGRCSTIGKTIMFDRNGSAVDAAIATMICAGVMNTHSTGIGGGDFMVVYDRPSQKSWFYDFREVAPELASASLYGGDVRRKLFGGLSIAVPGEIHGFWVAHKNHGRLPWRDLFEPTIQLCRKGFKLGAATGGWLIKKKEHVENFNSLKELFTNPETGKLYNTGDVMYRPRLARTLEIIANEGANAFYNGSLAKDIVDDIQEHNGIVTLADLGNYTTVVKETLSMQVDEGILLSTPPPSSGAILLYILNILKGYHFDSKSMEHDPVTTFHRIIEAFKFAYGQRRSFGDDDTPEFAELVRKLTSQDFGEKTRVQIWDNGTRPAIIYGNYGDDEEEKAGTSHASILAPDGSAVSITGTINYFFGSGMVGRKTGILFNDEMGDFSLETSGVSFPRNTVRPGKRPLSSMCPSILVDKNDDVKLVVGASGGIKIITAIAQVVARMLWFGENISDATDAKRLHHQLYPNYLSCEKGFDQEIIDDLIGKGHNLTAFTGSPVVQTIFVQPDSIEACSDYRKGGPTQGYPDGE